MDYDLIQKVVDLFLQNSNVRESPIVRDTLLIDKHGNFVWTRVTKLLLECYVRKLHNELISPASERGLEEAKYCVTGEVIISDTILRNIMPGQIIRMQEHHKQMCGCDYWKTVTSMENSLRDIDQRFRISSPFTKACYIRSKDTAIFIFFLHGVKNLIAEPL